MRNVTALPLSVTRTAAGVVALAAAAAALTAGAQPAAAKIREATPPARVVISGPEVVFPVTVTTSSSRRPEVSLWAGVRGGSVMHPAGYELARSGRTVTVTAAVDAAELPLGLSDWSAVDERDGHSAGFTVDARRGSKVAITHVEAGAGGRLQVRLRATYFEPDNDGGRWAPAAGATIRVQQLLDGGTWATVGKLRVNLDGLAGGSVRAPRDAVLRAVRADTATVWGGRSRTWTVASR